MTKKEIERFIDDIVESLQYECDLPREDLVYETGINLLYNYVRGELSDTDIVYALDSIGFEYGEPENLIEFKRIKLLEKQKRLERKLKRKSKFKQIRKDGKK